MVIRCLVLLSLAALPAWGAELVAPNTSKPAAPPPTLSRPAPSSSSCGRVQVHRRAHRRRGGQCLFHRPAQRPHHDLDVDGKLSTFMKPAGRSNGLFFDRKGNLIACADEKNELWRSRPTRR